MCVRERVCVFVVDRSISISVRCWYRLVAPGVVSGVSLVDVFCSDAPWLRLFNVSSTGPDRPMSWRQRQY